MLRLKGWRKQNSLKIQFYSLTWNNIKIQKSCKWLTLLDSIYNSCGCFYHYFAPSHKFLEIPVIHRGPRCFWGLIGSMNWLISMYFCNWDASRYFSFIIQMVKIRLDNVEAEVGQTGDSLLEFGSLSDFKIGFRWKNDSLMHHCLASRGCQIL